MTSTSEVDSKSLLRWTEGWKVWRDSYWI